MAVQREGFKLTAEYAPSEDEPQERKKVLSAEMVHQIFKRISDEDSWTLGYVPSEVRQVGGSLLSLDSAVIHWASALHITYNVTAWAPSEGSVF